MKPIIKIILLSLIIVAGCSDNKPYKIGFVGGLTGRFANLGVEARNGVMLAIEKINNEGGINGRSIVLITKDDKQNGKTALRVDKEMIDDGVVAIIGHMTSSMSVVGARLANKHKVLMISPTTSTNDLTGKDDYFFRVYPSSSDAAEKIADHAYKSGSKKIGAIYDVGNSAHTLPSLHYFKERINSLGGVISFEHKFISGPGTDFQKLARKSFSYKVDSIYILANAMDTAILCQHMSKMKKKIPVITSEWSVTKELLQFGGKTVEIMQFFSSFNKNVKNPVFLRFKESYLKRFGHLPNFASAHGYDCANVLFTALKKSKSSEKIKEAIINYDIFKGVQGKLSFNKYGDVKRDYFLMTVKDGKFAPVR